MSRKEGGRGLVSSEGSVDATIQGLKEFIKNSKEKLITAANNINITRINLRTNTKTTNKTSRKQKWEEKQQYGYFKRQRK